MFLTMYIQLSPLHQRRETIEYHHPRNYLIIVFPPHPFFPLPNHLSRVGILFILELVCTNRLSSSIFIPFLLAITNFSHSLISLNYLPPSNKHIQSLLRKLT